VTGCLRITRESIFTGINNFTVCSTFDVEYRDFIGFTKKETQDLLKDQGLSAYEPMVMDWYDGYNFSGASMLCPWSVLMFCKRALRTPADQKVQPQNFWANTSGNDIIEICLKRKNALDSERLQHLLDGGTELIDFPEYNTYPELDEHSSLDAMLGMMLQTGYVTAVNVTPDKKVEIKIPNKEVWDCFEQKTRLIFGKENPQWTAGAQALVDALLCGDADKVQKSVEDLLINYVSLRDNRYEAFYHGFILGALGTVSKPALISSNEESGKGYSDIILKQGTAAVVLELKRAQADDGPKRIATLQAEALGQIEKQKYTTALKEEGYSPILRYAMVFQGKSCYVKESECCHEQKPT
ncbi:MAG: PD-(D/E)XK nuclease domain-containing protein, partial [Succinivibrio sp.]|nr:PD-(D/E)XK nuclease domain-containing protein [Succinivibrio sp.]